MGHDPKAYSSSTMWRGLEKILAAETQSGFACLGERFFFFFVVKLR